MVLPAPHLHRKIRNTRGIVKANRAQQVPGLESKYPDDYVDLDTFNTFETVQPWKVRHIKDNILLGPEPQEPPEMSTLQFSSDKVLVLCVDFPDRPASVSTAAIYNRFFGSGNSLTNYYIENSYKLNTFTGEVHGWYRAPNNLSYYAGTTSGFGTFPANMLGLIRDVINIASQDTSINLNTIDANGDTLLSYIVIVHAGAEAAWTGRTSDLWAVTYTFSPSRAYGTTGKYYNKLMMSAEYMSSATDSQRSGVDCHEFGHVLDLDDLYAIDGSSNGVGIWSLMDSGNWLNGAITPGHLDAFSKLQLGWAVARKDVFGHIALVPSETVRANYLFTSNDINEYFIIENRRKIGFDTYLPGQGLLIWHINKNQPGNSTPPCLRVAVVQADNRNDLLNKVNLGDAGDPYPGATSNTSFGKNSTPQSSLCSGQIVDMILSNITFQDANGIIGLDSTLPCAKNPVICDLYIP